MMIIIIILIFIIVCASVCAKCNEPKLYRDMIVIPEYDMTISKNAFRILEIIVLSDYPVTIKEIMFNGNYNNPNLIVGCCTSLVNRGLIKRQHIINEEGKEINIVSSTEFGKEVWRFVRNTIK